ncbi:ferredoxin family protein [Amycolatopsis acidicola]|uniref:Ferredoxin n=1 Tax=Amycolatopsis acidicola TaxID=2596893 RepID=A0A5N0VLL7_9PSEU|nr:ferredoxin family protein [Amycolatopsis acidicola]KAA9166433.1 ferredoxin family protein [Amycolatopsis acidicola]
MSYVIGANCIDVTDRACLDVCPVDCIYVGERKSYINANECIDCGACEPECPVDAIFVDRNARGDAEKTVFVGDSIAFFTESLPGRDAPLGDPGGAGSVGDLGVDTEFVTAYQA